MLVLKSLQYCSDQKIIRKCDYLGSTFIYFSKFLHESFEVIFIP